MILNYENKLWSRIHIVINKDRSLMDKPLLFRGGLLAIFLSSLLFAKAQDSLNLHFSTPLTIEHSIHSPTSKDTIVFRQALDKASRSFVDFLPTIRDVLGIIAIIFGSWIISRTFFRNLKNDIVRKILERDFERQSELQERCHRIIDAYFSNLTSHGIAPPQKIQDAYEDIKTIDSIAFCNRPPIANSSFILKRVLQNILRYYDGKGELINYSIFIPIVRVLSHIENHSRRYISFPSFFQFYLFSRKYKFKLSKLAKYTLSQPLSYYRFYRAGIDLSPISYESLFIYDEFNSLRSNLISKSVYRVFNNPHPMLVLLFLNKTYAPLILETKLECMSGGNYKFYLAGFSHRTVAFEDGLEYTKLVYITETDTEGVGPNLIGINSFINDNDLFIGKLKSPFSISRVAPCDPHMITIEVKQQVTRDLFRNHKNQMARKLKSLKKEEMRSSNRP
jgi:hypothetical protein